MTPAQGSRGGATAHHYPAVRTRVISLLVALADNPRGLRRDWILRTVRGYNTVAPESATRYLRDDVPLLASAGITVTWDDHDVLRLDRSAWRSADPGFTAEEADALAMASQVAFPEDAMGELARDAWMKLAPIAVRDAITGGAVIFGDRVSLDGDEFAALTRAMQPPRTRIDFYYAPQVFGEETLRSIEPWQIVNLKGRWYVVGHDVDRGAVRVFRMARMVDVTATGVEATQPLPDGDVQEIAERTLNRGAEPVRAVVSPVPGTRPEDVADVLAGAEELGDGRWRLAPSTTSEVVDMGLDYAGLLVVEEPAAARERIISALRSIVDDDEGASR